MEPCSLEETVFIAYVYPCSPILPAHPLHRLFFERFDLPLRRIYNAVTVCGNAPRRSFKGALSDTALEVEKAEIRKAINEVDDVYETLQGVHGDRPVSHKIFEIYPRQDTRKFQLCLVRPVSQWAFNELMGTLEQRDAAAAHKFYKQIQCTSDAAAVRGRLWERQVHKYFRSLRDPTAFTICSLDNRTNSMTIEFSPATLHRDIGPIQTFEGELTSSIRGGKSCYLKPISKNFASIDAVLYEHGVVRPGLQPFLGAQMTDAATHPTSIKGLALIQKSLKLNVPELKALRPSSTKKWILLFIVPESMEASFVRQNFKDPEGGGSHWASKTAQYVLGLSPEQIWN